MNILCENCKKIVETKELKDRQRTKCPSCGRKGTYIPHATPKEASQTLHSDAVVDGVLFMSR